MRMLLKPVSAAILLLASHVPANAQNAPCPGDDQPPKLGAVASESAVCSRIGTDLLQSGGNAVDSIVGTVFCVGTVSMYHSGIGGGGFMLVRSSDGTYETVNFREMAPAAAHRDMYEGNFDGSLDGGLASGVPGELRGLEYVHEKYGNLPWKDVVLPAARLARDGFTVTGDLESFLDKVSPNDFLTEDPAWAIDFAPNGRLVREGDTMTRKRYAATLETIAEKGADAFYHGPIAKATIAAVQAANGTMTLADLENYTIAHGDPVTLDYGDYTLTTVGAPSSGAVALSILNILSGYPDFGDPAESLVNTHRLVEAMKFAYGQRSLMGDPEFESDVAELVANMTSADTADELRARISDSKTQNATYYEPQNLISDDPAGTSHLSSADASGMSVSLTTTVNTLFGSKVIVPETGIVMNNQMDDFSVPGKDNAFGYVPNPANYIEAGKRPLSSISPVIVEYADGGLYYTIGAAGGSRIITSTVQNLIHVLNSGLTVAEALAQPRLHDQLRPTETTFEWAYSNETVSYLEGLGHNVTWVAPGSSTAQGTRLLPNGTFEAAGEPRQGNSGGLAV